MPVMLLTLLFCRFVSPIFATVTIYGNQLYLSMQSPAIGKVPACTGTIPDLHLLAVPSHYVGTDPDLVLKMTASGVTFLHDRRFRKRYTGSTTCAVDINGKLWLNAGDLAKDISKHKEKDKKKRVSKPANPLKLFTETSSGDLCTPEPGAISDENGKSENFSPDSPQNATKVAKKIRVKSYSVDKAKVRQRILAMINTQRGKKHLFFWTVSFPQHTPDDVCYQAFNTWLTALRSRKMLREYLWVAERQMGDRLKTNKVPTHTIHFHIAIPHYLNVQRANAMMRGTLKGLAKKGLLPGVVCNPKSKESYYLPSIARYNGVDISKHRTTRKPINFAVKKGARALAHYLTKYVTKNDAGQTNEAGELIAPGFTHLAWHNSRGFSALFTGVTCSLSEFKKGGFGGYLNRVRAFRMEFATFVPWLFGPPPILMDHLYKLNSEIQILLGNG